MPEEARTEADFIWTTPALPRREWVWFDVEEDEDFKCEFCGFPHVKWVHKLKHETGDRILQVGCVCASKLCANYSEPKEKEAEAKKRKRWTTRREERLKRWVTKGWYQATPRHWYKKFRNTYISIYARGDSAELLQEVSFQVIWRAGIRFRSLKAAAHYAFEIIEAGKIRDWEEDEAW